MKTSLLTRSLAAVLALLLSVSPDEAQEYELLRLGLTDAEFTSSSGVQQSGLAFAGGPADYVASFLAGGYTAGQSTKYSGTNAFGAGAWMASLATGVTMRVGLTGNDYTVIGGPMDGYQVSTLTQLNGHYAAGTSEMYSGGGMNGEAAWVANGETGVTKRVGFYSSEFTNVSGGQFNTVITLAGGYAAGATPRFNGATDLGNAVWVANALSGFTTRLGYYDGGHTLNGGALDGYQFSDIYAQDLAHGYVAGVSARYSGATHTGYEAWATNVGLGTTNRIGFDSSDYTRADGYQASSPYYMANGYTVGTSAKYVDMALRGNALWVADSLSGSTTTRLGFFGSEYTHLNGTQNSELHAFNGTYATGLSDMYNGSTYLGQAAWVAAVAGGSSTRIGLFSGEFTKTGGADDGYQGSTVYGDISGSYVMGESVRYSGTDVKGSAAWIANAATGQTTRVGLTDGEFTSSDGIQQSQASFLRGSYVAGISTIYNGVNGVGIAAWMANGTPGGTTRIGLWGTGYTGAGGVQGSVPREMTASYVVGFSDKYSATYLGQAAWVARTGGGTTRLGLTGSDYTMFGGSQTGYQYSDVFFVNGDYAAGYSQKYDGTSERGRTAWVYDLNTDVLDSITLSIRVTDGYEYSNVEQLFANGLALGTYELFDGVGNDLGGRVFAWTPTDGAFDLGAAVQGGLSAAGWSMLTDSRVADPITGAILGTGTLLSNASSQGVFLAIPTPEPGTSALLLSSGLLLARRRRASA